jgi:hypothetical protein
VFRTSTNRVHVPACYFDGFLPDLELFFAALEFLPVFAGLADFFELDRLGDEGTARMALTESRSVR